jgi:hypothetical protein
MWPFSRKRKTTAVQWFNHGDHPAVYDQGTRKIGWLRDDSGDFTPVHPGFWIVTHANGKITAHTPPDYAENFAHDR